MGLVMGATAIAIVMSPWGKRSGGHFNPAITFTFYRLGKVEFWDAWLYVIAQFLGAIGGVALARYVLRGALDNHAVRYAVTVPGVYGSTVAFLAELAISFILMITVLFATNHKRLAPYTAYFVGVLIAISFIRSTAVPHEHEPGTNIRLSASRQRLARTVDLSHSSVDGYAGRRRGVSSSPSGRRSLLRQTSPRQQRTLHLPSRATRSLERRSYARTRQIDASPE
jgi:hypothetical protein